MLIATAFCQVTDIHNMDRNKALKIASGIMFAAALAAAAVSVWAFMTKRTLLGVGTTAGAVVFMLLSAWAFTASRNRVVMVPFYDNEYSRLSQMLSEAKGGLENAETAAKGYKRANFPNWVYQKCTYNGGIAADAISKKDWNTMIENIQRAMDDRIAKHSEMLNPQPQ